MHDTDASSPERESASRLLANLANGWPGERLALGDVAAALSDRAYGVLLLIFAAPNIIPSPIPGISGVLGVPLVLVAAQMLMGRPRPWFPEMLAGRSIATRDFQALMGRILPRLEWMERLLRPRLRFMVAPLPERILAGLILVLAVVLVLPIPLGNMLPALAVSLIALGLIEHDGLAILIGVVVAILSLAVVALVFAVGIEALVFFVKKAF